jgi:hypothetical protein
VTLFRSLPILLLAATLSPQPAHAQRDGFRIAVSGFGGGVAFSDFQRRSVQYATPGELSIRSMDQAISVSPTVFAGASIGILPANDWGLRFSYAYARSHFDTYSLDRGAPVQLSDQDKSALVGMQILASDLVFRLPPKIGRVRTYGLAGVGWTSYRTPTRNASEEELDAPRHRGRWTGTFGLGARVPLENAGLSLEFELADHVARTPWQAEEIDTATNGEVMLTSSEPVTPVRLVNQVSFSVGMRYTMRIGR